MICVYVCVGGESPGGEWGICVYIHVIYYG